MTKSRFFRTTITDWFTSKGLELHLPTSDFDRISNLIENGLDVNAFLEDASGQLIENPYPMSFWSYVVETRNLKLMELLLESDKKPNVDAEDFYGRSALISILRSNKQDNLLEIIKLLLEHGADANQFSCRGVGWSPLEFALRKANCYPDIVVEIVELLILYKANIERLSPAKIITPLMLMADQKGFNSQKIVQLLIENNANLNATDEHGFSAFLHAVSNNNYPMVKLLLDYKSDLNIRDNNGKNALMLLYSFSKSTHKDLEIAQLLVDRGIDINATDKEGNTALMYALMHGVKEQHACKEHIQVLLSHDNIDLNIENINSHTALYLASLYGDEEIVSLIMESSMEKNVEFVC